jgi:hypothetical protein
MTIELVMTTAWPMQTMINDMRLPRITHAKPFQQVDPEWSLRTCGTEPGGFQETTLSTSRSGW